MFETTIDRNGNTVTLKLKGSLTIQNALPLRDFLLTVPRDAEMLIFNHEEVEEIDLSWLQLIVSFHKTMAETGKTIIFTGTELFKSLLNNSGFNSYKWLTTDTTELINEGSENE